MAQPLQSITDALLQAARKAGADHADAMAVRGTSVSIDVRGGGLEHAERSEGVDIGLRVLIGQQVATVSASDTSEQTITEMASRAVAMAKEAPKDPYAGLAEPEQLIKTWDIDAFELQDPTAEPDPQSLQENAAEAEAAALEIKGISQVQSASAAYGRNQIHLAASNGFSGGYERSERAVSCVAIAGRDAQMERDYSGDNRVFQSDLRPAQEIGQEAAKRALERLNARKPPTGYFPVLFDERISSTLIGHLLGAVNGASVGRGASWLRDALGEEILPKELSLIEDPHRKRVAASRPFDAEGLSTKKRAIIENGVLTGWTLDLANGRKLGMPSSANAVRSPASSPSPGNWSVALTQGDKSQAQLLRDMGTGLLVTSMIGATINPNTGEYSRGAAGIWVENGAPQYAVNECTIAGNLREMLRSIVPANDARTHLSRVVPSLLVEGMTLAGA